MSLKQKIMFLATTLTIFMALVGAIGGVGISMLSKRLTHLGHTSLPSMRNLILADMVSDGSHGMIYRVILAAKTDDAAELKAAKAETEELFQRFMGYLDELDKQDLDAEAQTRLDALKSNVRNYIAEGNRIITTAANQGSDQALALMPQFAKSFEADEEAMDSLATYIQESVNKSIEEDDKTGHTLIVVMIVSVGIAFAISMYLGLLITNKVVGPIVGVQSSLEEIASGEGDLTRRISVTTQDEVGALAAAFNRFIDKLQGIIKGVSDNAQVFSTKSQNLLGSAQQLSVSAKEVKTAVDAVAGAGNHIDQQTQALSKTGVATASDVGEIRAAADEMASVIVGTAAAT